MPGNESDGSAGPSQQISAGRDGYAAGRDIYVQLSAPFGDTSLGHMSKGKGAQRIIDWSKEDPTLDRAAGLLVSVAAAEAAPALRLVLDTDPDLVVALLAGLNEVRAAALIGELGPTEVTLDRLLEAAEAISACERQDRQALGARTGWLSWVTSGRNTQGFQQKYERGAVYWSASHGAQATTGAIAEFHRGYGGCRGWLGFPVAAAEHGAHPRTGTEFTWQRFEGRRDYSPEVCRFLEVICGATVFSSQKHGTHATPEAIGDLYERDWRDQGRLGLPVEDLVRVGPSPAGTTGGRQRFEAETLYLSGKTGPITVPQSWVRYLEKHGDVGGPAGFPVSVAKPAAPSPHGTTGRYQRFEGPGAYPDDVLARLEAGELPFGATIYYSEQHGPHLVEGGNGVVYERLQGTASWLGFPISDEAPADEWGDAPEGTVQYFEGGAIFHTAEHGSVPVRDEVLELLTPELAGQLGFPVSDAEPLAAAENSYIQLFEHGLATVRDGRTQFWFAHGS